MVFPLYVSLERLDKRLLEASKDLGAGRLATFRQVTLPLSAPGLLSGVLLVFIPIMGEYIIPAMLGGGKVFFIGNALVDLFLQSRDWPFGSAASIVLILVTLVAVSLYLWLGSRGQVRREVSILSARGPRRTRTRAGRPSIARAAGSIGCSGRTPPWSISSCTSRSGSSSCSASTPAI
jgi:ABC-type Fe3+ transport system permease subunit